MVLDRRAFAEQARHVRESVESAELIAHRLGERRVVRGVGFLEVEWCDRRAGPAGGDDCVVHALEPLHVACSQHHAGAERATCACERRADAAARPGHEDHPAGSAPGGAT